MRMRKQDQTSRKHSQTQTYLHTPTILHSVQRRSERIEKTATLKTYVCGCGFMYMYTNVHTYIHSYAHTHTHTQYTR